MSVVITVVVAAFANSLVDLYRPVTNPTPVSANIAPDAPRSESFTITSQGNVLPVALPGGVLLPSRRDTVVVGLYGPVPTTTYVAKEPSGDAFIAIVSTLPQETFERSKASQILDGWRNYFLRSRGSRATSQEELTLAGHEGRRMYFESAAVSLVEGLKGTLTLHRLGVYGVLGVSFKTTHCIESANTLIEERCAKVDAWKNSNQRQRWLATALLDIEPRLRRVKGHRNLPKLEASLRRALNIKQQPKRMEKAA